MYLICSNPFFLTLNSLESATSAVEQKQPDLKSSVSTTQATSNEDPSSLSKSAIHVQKNVGDDEDGDVDIIAIEDDEIEVQGDSSVSNGTGEDVDKTLTEESTNEATKEAGAAIDNAKNQDSNEAMVEKSDRDKMVEDESVAAEGSEVSTLQKDECEKEKAVDKTIETSTTEDDKKDAESASSGATAKGGQAEEPGEGEKAEDGASRVNKRLVYTFNAPTTTLHTTTTTIVNTVQFIGLSTFSMWTCVIGRWVQIISVGVYCLLVLRAC